MARWLQDLVRVAARRPGRVLAVVGALVVVGAVLALLRLSPSAATGTLVGSGSDAGRRDLGGASSGSATTRSTCSCAATCRGWC